MSKRASKMWKALSVEERKPWETKAKEEKERYNNAKKAYKGPVSATYLMNIPKVYTSITSPNMHLICFSLLVLFETTIHFSSRPTCIVESSSYKSQKSKWLYICYY